MGSYLNIKMLFSLPGVHTSHMNEHEATVVHPGLIINTGSFPKQILRSHCVRVSAELSLARGRLPPGESSVSTEICRFHVRWPLQCGLLHSNSVMNHEHLQEVTVSRLVVTGCHTPGGRDARVSRQELGAQSLLPISPWEGGQPYHTRMPTSPD